MEHLNTKENEIVIDLKGEKDRNTVIVYPTFNNE